MNIKKPVFIIGTGRSGSTIFHRMLSEHPNLAWSSKLNQWFPAHPGFNCLLMHAIDILGVGSILQSLVHPKENYQFWDYWCRGFSEPCRDLTAEDTNPVNAKVAGPLAQMLTTKRNRLLMKITGWPRIGFLKAIFPDAKFIHILRDGRAVSASLLRQPWWRGWQGPEKWRWGRLTAEQEQLWQQYKQSFIVLAAMEWMILMDSFDTATANLPDDDYKLIKYEDLCGNVSGVMKSVTDFCELDWAPEFDHCMKGYSLRCANDKYKTELNETQQRDLEKVLTNYLHRYGYA